MVSPETLEFAVKVSVNMAVNSLVNGDYDLLEQDVGPDLSTTDLRAIVDSYPVRLIAPPDESYETLAVLHDPDADPPVFHVAVRLWTEHGEPSRMVMKFRVTHMREIHPLSMENEIVGMDIEDP